jgi:hypothetical protein
MVTTYDAFVVNLRNIVIQIKNNYCSIINLDRNCVWNNSLHRLQTSKR